MMFGGATLRQDMLIMIGVLIAAWFVKVGPGLLLPPAAVSVTPRAPSPPPTGHATDGTKGIHTAALTRHISGLDTALSQPELAGIKHTLRQSSKHTTVQQLCRLGRMCVCPAGGGAVRLHDVLQEVCWCESWISIA